MPGARRSLVGKNAFQPTCWADLAHSWTSGSPKQARSNQVVSVSPPWDHAPAKRFRPAKPAEVARLSPPPADKWKSTAGTAARPINIIEHGDKRTVVEAVFVCGASALIRQYLIGHTDGSLEIRDRLFNISPSRWRTGWRRHCIALLCALRASDTRSIPISAGLPCVGNRRDLSCI